MGQGVGYKVGQRVGQRVGQVAHPRPLREAKVSGGVAPGARAAEVPDGGVVPGQLGVGVAPGQLGMGVVPGLVVDNAVGRSPGGGVVPGLVVDNVVGRELRKATVAACSTRREATSRVT